MKRTDYIDTDLVLRRDRAVGGPSSPNLDEEDVPMRSISAVSLNRMAKHKEEIRSGVASAVGELESLRRRQEDLERERKNLEELAKKQVDYEQGRRDILDRLHEGVVALEQKEVHAAQLTDLLVTSRNRFKELLEEIGRIDEEQWADERFHEELTKALVVVEGAQMEFNKALARIHALEERSESILEQRAGLRGEEAGPVGGRTWGAWIRIGAAISVPFWILALAGFVAFVILR